MEAVDPQVTLGIILLLVGVGLLAGWVDAVVGGGGLIQLPAILLVPDMSAVQALATNKFGSVFGAAMSSATYLRSVRIDRSAAIPAALIAGGGAACGAAAAAQVPEGLFRPIILVVLIGVAVFTLLKPTLGTEASLRFADRPRRHHAAAWAIGAVIGFYDGIVGPGTGSFLVIGFVAVLGLSFLEASATAKLVNCATNLGALAYFGPAGHIVFSLGAALAVGNLAGGFLGAKTAIRFGSGFVRIVFIVVVTALIISLGAQTLLT